MPRQIIRIPVWIILSLCVAFSQPQSSSSSQTESPRERLRQVYFERFSVDNGLSHNSIRSLAQDSTGYIWIGTEYGLNRYNGYEFKQYLHVPEDSTSISFPIITSLHVTANGTLWVGTVRGICVYNPKRDCFERLPTLDGGKELPRLTIHMITSDKEGNVWAASGQGVIYFNAHRPSLGGILYRTPSPESVTKSLLSILYDNRGRLLIGQDNILFEFDRSHRAFLLRTRFPDSISVKNDHLISWLHEDAEGFIWAFRNDGLTYKLDPATLQVSRRYVLPDLNSNMKGIAQEQTLKGDVVFWVPSQIGITRFNTVSGTLSSIPLNVDGTPLSQTLTPNSASIGGRIVFRDRSGVYWVGDETYGLFKYAPHRLKFRVYRHNPFNARSLSDNYIRGISADKDENLWICTQYGGVNHLNPTRDSATVYAPNSPKEFQLSHTPALWQTYSDKNGYTWLPGKPPVLINPQGKIMRSFRLHPQDTSHWGEFFHQNDTVFWIHAAGDRSLVRISYRKGDQPSAYKRQLFTSLPFIPLACDSEGTLVGMKKRRGFREDSLGTLFHWNPLTGQMQTRYWEMLVSFLEDPNTGCYLTLDSHGRCWFSAKGAGVCVVDGLKNESYRLTERSGLPHNNAYIAMEDRRGKIWISSDAGLCEFDADTKQFRRFTVADGLQSQEFNRQSFYRSASGELFFGGINGFNAFFPEETDPNPQAPALIIENFRTISRNILIPSAFSRSSAADTITLTYIERSFEAKLAALEFTAPSRNGYQWFLEGFDHEWRSAVTKRDIAYTNVEAGTYRLFAKACNSDGAWSSERLMLTVVVLPPWWQTWTFRLTAGIVSAALLFGLYRMRLRATRLRAERLEREVAERTSELLEANTEIQRQISVQTEQAREIEYANSELQEKNLALDEAFKELQQAQSQLVHSERMNAAGMLTAGVMHEINNPNAAVIAAVHDAKSTVKKITEFFFSLLDERSKHSQKAQQFSKLTDEANHVLEIASVGAMRVKGIVANLQHFTKHQREGMYMGSFDTEFVSTLEMFHYQFKQTTIITDIEKGLALEANWGELNQIMLNLLINAVQAGAGQIQVKVHTSGENRVVVHVSDDGSGMSAEVSRRIFEPFFSTKSSGNNGLGLSISKQIIERHGGTISCESTIGEGTNFFITLPITTTTGNNPMSSI